MRHIAVIEDNPDNRLLVHAILEDHFELSEFESGQQALARMPDHPPDVILLDISLPEMDGREVLKEIRRTPNLADIPVIALTAHAMVGDRERFLAAGFDDYISKPILEPERLIGAVTGLLEPPMTKS